MSAAPLSAAPRQRAACNRGATCEIAHKEQPARAQPELPREWLPSRGPECITRGPNVGFCAGPRRVPKPHGPAAELAQRLDLGRRSACALLLGRAPKKAWVEVAQSTGAAPRWLWPVEESRLLRGTGNLRAAAKRRIAQFTPGAQPSSSRRHAHEGLDIGAKEGTPIRAAQHGLVVYSDNGLTGYGNLVMVLHKDASVALYAHCRSTFVFPGQRVMRGQIIGEVGHTGYARGPHLHFEYRVDGFAKDPSALFEPR
jgi:murein DD-endopeptidase MepM/ murein hydrolase activator NlpD